jgi:hypothetical protein
MAPQERRRKWSRNSGGRGPEPAPPERLSQIPGPATPAARPVPTLPSGAPPSRGSGPAGGHERTDAQGHLGRPPRRALVLPVASNLSPRFTVPALALAKIYVKYAAEVDLRADVLWAQMLHETGHGSGTSLPPEQLRASAPPGVGRPDICPHAEAGAKAHTPTWWPTCTPPIRLLTNATVGPHYASTAARPALPT